MFCPKCGQQNNEDVARFCQSCGYDLTLGKQTVGASTAYAGFLPRLAALVIDSIIVSAATGVLTAATLGIGWFSIFFLPWVYEAVMLSGQKRATVGKMVLGIEVTDLNGGRISFGRATGRHFAKYVSALILFIGFVMAAFTEKKQALHDMMADTLVISNRQ